MKKLFALIGALAMGASLASCSSGGTTKIGILKYVNDAPLNQAQQGFVDAVNAAKLNVEFIYRDANADANLNVNQALDLVTSCDLVLGIATPSSTALVSARETKSKTCPVLFTAVTDPIDAGYAEAYDKTTNNITGTSDMNPVAEQIQLFKDINPECTTIGILYCSNETNSVKQKELAEAKCNELGMTLKVATVDQANQITAALNKLVSEGIQGLYIPTDNLVVSNFESTCASICDTNKIITVAGEGTLVANSVLASRSLDYYELGKITGEQAVRILNGAKVSDVHIQEAENFPLVINKTHADQLQISIPQTLIDEARESGTIY